MSHRPVTTESFGVKCLLVGATLTVLVLFLFLPLCAVFNEALRKGTEVFFASLREPVAASAIKLTLLTAAIAVPLNALFGVAAAWLVTKFRFPGRSLLVALIDLPFAVSPVVAGLVWMLIFGSKGWLPPGDLADLLAPLAKVVLAAAETPGFGWLSGSGSNRAKWRTHASSDSPHSPTASAQPWLRKRRIACGKSAGATGS